MLKKTIALALAVSGAAYAQEFKPAVVFDLGGKFDKSFNEGVWNGVKRFSEETGIEVLEYEVSSEAERKQAIERMVKRRGATAVLGIGFGQADALAEIAAANPDVQFGIIDVNWLDGANIKQYGFQEHEGSYLVGVAAAKASKTGKAGFVGGMDIPLIRRFACGYAQGFKDAGGSEVYVNMTGDTAAAWNNPTRGGELAQSQFDRGADVVFAAAGGTGVGVLQAAKDKGKLAIGVDSNQNHLHPGTMLTSMLKRVDVAAYNFFKEAQSGRVEGAVHTLGLKDEGVGWAVDEHNEDMVASFRADIDKARDDIIAGRIEVNDYFVLEGCPSY
ncbi:MAG: BMP family ABC transporter substrate-binding protein [Betaproteobacteria bacterium AqS2]|uniref:BMP family ABC transporter substrate-binding protein n=1 Tax=Candidatus Amphirhobacter heronislandensis TaxID=1732024 RepID=A0A930UGN1_9GAMM|nr:BMP family ABC transporter substrate-binding protein [Betaproteobacteria bacterium AqS2]